MSNPAFQLIDPAGFIARGVSSLGGALRRGLRSLDRLVSSVQSPYAMLDSAAGRSKQCAPEA